MNRNALALALAALAVSGSLLTGAHAQSTPALPATPAAPARPDGNARDPADVPPWFKTDGSRDAGRDAGRSPSTGPAVDRKVATPEEVGPPRRGRAYDVKPLIDLKR